MIVYLEGMVNIPLRSIAIPVWANTLRTPRTEQIWLAFHSKAFCQEGIQWEQATLQNLTQLTTFLLVRSKSTEQEIAH